MRSRHLRRDMVVDLVDPILDHGSVGLNLGSLVHHLALFLAAHFGAWQLLLEKLLAAVAVLDIHSALVVRMDLAGMDPVVVAVLVGCLVDPAVAFGAAVDPVLAVSAVVEDLGRLDLDQP